MVATPPAEAIRARIRREGPMPFADFMEMALYGEGGYYQRPPVGERGDFVTGPHVSPLFGLSLAECVRRAWEQMSQQGPPAVIELGAGDGTLASQLHEAIPDLRYAAVEISSGARAELAAKGFEVHATIEELPERLTAVVLANELLDNLPFSRIRRTDDGLREVLVGLEGDALIEVGSPCPPALAAVAPTLRPGEEAAVSLASLRLVEALASRLERGYILFVDYERVPSDVRGGLHGYREHRVVGDLLADPGSCDITAPVDLGALAVAARSAGLEAHQPISQRDALHELGWARLQEEERLRQAEALDRSDGRAALRSLDLRNRAALLVDPSGPGDLRWLILSTPGLPTLWRRSLP